MSVSDASDVSRTYTYPGFVGVAVPPGPDSAYSTATAYDVVKDRYGDGWEPTVMWLATAEGDGGRPGGQKKPPAVLASVVHQCVPGPAPLYSVAIACPLVYALHHMESNRLIG